MTQVKLHLCAAKAVLSHESSVCDFADMDLLIGSWNIMSLVECSDDVRTCRSRPVSVAVSENVDHKLDFLVKELKRYHVCIAGIQETKWFGKDV